LENSLCEFSKFSRSLHSVSVVAGQAPLALSNAKVSCKHGLWLVAREKKSLVSTGIAPIEDEGSNILRVTTSVAGKPASQSHPPQVSAVLSDESVPF